MRSMQLLICSLRFALRTFDEKTECIVLNRFIMFVIPLFLLRFYLFLLLFLFFIYNILKLSLIDILLPHVLEPNCRDVEHVLTDVLNLLYVVNTSYLWNDFNSDHFFCSRHECSSERTCHCNAECRNQDLKCKLEKIIVDSYFITRLI